MDEIHHAQSSDAAEHITAARRAQLTWAAIGVKRRLRAMRRMRLELAQRANEFVAAMPATLQRSAADTLIAEVLPLLDACRFLEMHAAAILAPRTFDQEGGSAWIGSIEIEVRRDPAGVVLILAPANYPLFLAGVQCLQTLAAGNAVLWKPAPGTSAVAHLFALCWAAAARADAPALQVLDESVAAGTDAMNTGVDRVFLTGSSATGEVVMRELAKTQTSSVMELSGCDAVFVLENADHQVVADALAFGLRFNGSATCMAPRRLFVTNTVANKLLAALTKSFTKPVPHAQPEKTLELLSSLIEDAQVRGAELLLDGRSTGRVTGPTLIDRATPNMRVMQTDIGVPVLAAMRVASMDEALQADARCQYALTAAVFGPENQARDLAVKINAGTVFINDLMTPSADARAPFAGRKRSGFGVTRGAEGLLAATNVKTVLTQRSHSQRRYQPTTAVHGELFSAYIALRHGRNLLRRFAAIPRLARAAITMNRKRG